MIVIGQNNNHSISKGFMNPESGKGSTSPEFTGIGKGSSEAQLRYNTYDFMTVYGHTEAVIIMLVNMTT